jgi:class 3 adenylate cyclase
MPRARAAPDTDIVDSTVRAREMGDKPWRELLQAHDATVRREMARFRGSEVKCLGDGFLILFDGPARAAAETLRVQAADGGFGRCD